MGFKKKKKRKAQQKIKNKKNPIKSDARKLKQKGEMGKEKAPPTHSASHTHTHTHKTSFVFCTICTVTFA